MILEVIGYIGGLLIAIALLPQIIKAIKTKSTKDLSLLWTFILFTGLVLYDIVAIINRINFLIVFATIEAILTLILIFLKIKYG